MDAIRLRADVDPAAFLRLVGYLVRHRPEILHTHLVHADTYGQMAGLLARIPVRFSTKHGFNEFREGRAFALGDRTVASLAHVHVAISRGLARYLAETEGFDESGFEVVHYGIAPGAEPAPFASSVTSRRSSRRSRRLRSSSSRRWARGSGWSRWRRWSAPGR